MDQIATSGVQAPAAGGQGQAGQADGQPVGPSATGIQGTPQGQQPGAPAGQPGRPGLQTQGAGQAPQKVEVTVDVLKALRTEIQSLKDKYGDAASKVQQFEMMQRMGGFTPPPNQPPPQTQGQGQPQPPGGQQDQTQDLFSGLEDSDLVSVNDLKKMIPRLRGNPADINGALAPVNAVVSQLQVQMQDPNYEQTIRTYLPDMINANPMFAEMIQRAPNRLLAALAVSKMSPRYLQVQAGQQQGTPGNGANNGPPPPPDPLALLQQIIENQTKPGSPGAMGGGTSGSISGFDRFRNMDPMSSEFEAEVNRVLNSGGR